MILDTWQLIKILIVNVGIHLTLQYTSTPLPARALNYHTQCEVDGLQGEYFAHSTECFYVFNEVIDSVKADYGGQFSTDNQSFWCRDNVVWAADLVRILDQETQDLVEAIVPLHGSSSNSNHFLSIAAMDFGNDNTWEWFNRVDGRTDMFMDSGTPVVGAYENWCDPCVVYAPQPNSIPHVCMGLHTKNFGTPTDACNFEWFDRDCADTPAYNDGNVLCSVKIEYLCNQSVNFGNYCANCTLSECTICEPDWYIYNPTNTPGQLACYDVCPTGTFINDPPGVYCEPCTVWGDLCLECNHSTCIRCVEPYLPDEDGYCDCRDGYQTSDTEKPCECNDENICAKNHFAPHDGIPSARGYASTSDDQRRDLVLENEERVVKYICMGEFWGAFVTLDYQLFMWGEEIDNGYIFSEISVHNAIQIDTSDWDGYPVKVECTRSGIFVLTTNQSMYLMGRSDDHEIEGDKKILKFVKSEMIGILDIFASYHSLYLLLEEMITVSYIGGGSVDLHRIFAIGMDHSGCLASNYSMIHSGGEYEEIDYAFVSDVYELYSTKPDLFFYDHNGDGNDQPVIPRIKAFDSGLWVSYKLKIEGGVLESARRGFLDFGTHEFFHFYAGLTHPSKRADTPVLTLIDFSETAVSELDNSDPIDWVDRPFGGCLTIVSRDKIYVQGDSSCNDGPGLNTNVRYSTPFEIEDYGDYSGEEIYNFVCNQACYILTEEYLFMFGSTLSGIGFDAICPNNDCTRPTLAKSDVAFVVPGKGVYIPNDEKSIDIKYDTVWFTKSTPFHTNKNDVVYEHPPELWGDSGLVDNILTIQLRKNEVFYQMDPEITFTNSTHGLVFPDDVCVWPKVGRSNWTVKNSDDSDYFELVMDWGNFRTHCGVKGPFDVDGWSGQYDHYFTRLLFTEKFYRGRLFEHDMVKTEEFFMDIEVRFPKKVLMAEITVQQDEWDEYWDAYIVDKTFDRETRRGEIMFSTVTRFPNFFVFPEKAVEALNQDDYSHFPGDVTAYARTKKLGDVFPNNPEYFKVDEDVYYLVEVDGETGPLDTTVSCDNKNCYQSWRLHFRIIDDYRVCHVPMTSFPINWVQFCLISEMSDEYHEIPDDTSGDHEDCVDPSREVQFLIKLSIDNLCGGELVETIDSTFWMHLYADWTYPEPPIDTDTAVFSVGDWLYFKAGVDSTKVTIENCQIDNIYWEDSAHTKQYLYVYDETTKLRTRTQTGDTVKLVIDEMDSVKEVGFHFKLHNELLMLQPDDKKTYQIFVYISVTYKGNDEDVRPTPPRRSSAQISLGNSLVSGALDLTVEYAGAERLGVVPYVALIACVVCLAVALWIVVVIGIGVLVYNRTMAMKNKYNIQEGTVVGINHGEEWVVEI